MDKQAGVRPWWGGKHVVAAAVALACLAVWAAPAVAALIQPTSVGAPYVPPGSQNIAQGRDGSATKPFIDDAFLTSITFPTVTFTAAKSEFRAVKTAYVAFGRDNVNAEFGDDDDGGDGNHNPFVKAGVYTPPPDVPPDTTRQSMDPAIQDPAIAAAFGDLSLVEGVDGEGHGGAGAGDYQLNLIFESPIVDNDDAPDGCPELIIFERGDNSYVRVFAIVSGTADAPTWLPDYVDIGPPDMVPTGICIDTYEIGGAQELVAVGVDLDDFNIGDGQPIIGIIMASTNVSGADLTGIFLSTESDGRIPEPGSALLIGLGLAGASFRRRR